MYFHTFRSTLTDLVQGDITKEELHLWDTIPSCDIFVLLIVTKRINPSVKKNLLRGYPVNGVFNDSNWTPQHV